MSNKNQKVNENEAMENKAMEPEVPVVEETKEKLGTKVLSGVKKHGKKVAGIAVGIGVGVLGYALGSKFGKGDNTNSDDVAVDYAAIDYAEEGLE